jgi:hypothetical protein
MGYQKHDITRDRSPAYTISMKTPDFAEQSPEPCYIKPGLTRFGKDRVPGYIMKENIVESVLDETPGPGTYYREKYPMRGKQPGYTVGVRRSQPMPETPGPNEYHIPSYFGPKTPTKPSSPSYTFRGRTLEDGVPGYIMKENIVESVRDQTPGPATYYREKYPMRGRKQPGYTIGVRRSQPMPETPGPNEYHIPSYFGSKTPTKPSSPSYTFRGRILEPGHIIPPGPAEYTLPVLDRYKAKSPVYTMTGRPE